MTHKKNKFMGSLWGETKGLGWGPLYTKADRNIIGDLWGTDGKKKKRRDKCHV